MLNINYTSYKAKTQKNQRENKKWTGQCSHLYQWYQLEDSKRYIPHQLQPIPCQSIFVDVLVSLLGTLMSHWCKNANGLQDLGFEKLVTDSPIREWRLLNQHIILRTKAYFQRVEEGRGRKSRTFLLSQVAFASVAIPSLSSTIHCDTIPSLIFWRKRLNVYKWRLFKIGCSTSTYRRKKNYP